MRKNYLLTLYIIGLVILLGMKYIYSIASCEDLNFILAPTARWVTLISGVKFTKLSDVGYINHSIHFIIAPGCSGVQFMLITFASLFFPFVHRMKSVRGGVCWFAGSLVFSYPFAIFVNGLRIVLAIYIPVYFDKWNINPNWLTSERLHTIIGTVVYVVSLLTVHPLAGLVVKSKENTSPEILSKFLIDKFPGRLHIKLAYHFVPPLLCYFSIVLIIPLLHNVRQNNFDKFLEYAVLTTSVCFAVIIIFCITYVVREHLRGRK